MSLNISEAIPKQVGTIKNTYRPLQQGRASDVAVVSNHKKKIMILKNFQFPNIIYNSDCYMNLPPTRRLEAGDFSVHMLKERNIYNVSLLLIFYKEGVVWLYL